MAFLDFVRSQMGTDPRSAAEKFAELLQAGAKAIQSAQPNVTSAVSMAAGQIPNPLGQALDAVGRKGQGMIPLVSVGPSPSPAPIAANPMISPSPSIQGPKLPDGFLNPKPDTRMPYEQWRQGQVAQGLAKPRTSTRATTAEERLSGPSYESPAWIDTLDEDQLQLAANDPETAMRYVLTNSGQAAEGPLGEFFMQRAEPIANLYYAQSGNFLDPGQDPQGLMTYMQAWVDKMTADTSSPGQKTFSDNMRTQAGIKADEILRSTAEGTAGGAFRSMIEGEIAESQGRKNEFTVYWERLIKPTLVAQRSTATAIHGTEARFNKLVKAYKDAQFMGTATDFGQFLVQNGFRLAK